jgi:hypothetical protein
LAKISSHNKRLLSECEDSIISLNRPRFLTKKKGSKNKKGREEAPEALGKYCKKYHSGDQLARRIPK